MADDPDHGFQVMPLPKVGLLDRAFGRLPREAAFIEIRNHLATTAFDRVRPSSISDALAKSRLRPRDAVEELTLIFEHAAFTLAADRELGASDRAALSTLQQAFELTDEEAGAARTRAASAVLRKAVRERLAGPIVGTNVRLEVETLGTALGLTDAQVTALYADAAGAVVQAAFDAAIADRRYDEAEEKQVHAVAESFGVALDYSEKTAATVERYRVMARAARGQLPTVAVPVLLTSGESCCFAASAVAHKEMRTVTKRINYGGLTASVRIAGNVRWRLGSISPQRVMRRGSRCVSPWLHHRGRWIGCRRPPLTIPTIP